MAFSTTWDLDKYKSEFESEEQWQLRKKFMQAHKHKFPEDKLVCLARVFFNVEFLGCRYPEKTMRLVAELSKGVADDYREKQKGKLKRTFVQASDAAGAKVKGKGATPPSKITEGPPSKAPKTSDSNPSSADFKYTCFVHEDLVKPPPLPEGEFPGFIIYESCKTNCPVNILTQSAQKSKVWNVISFNFPAEKNTTSNTERYCEITLKNKALSSGVGLTNKEAKVNAAIEGLNKLRQTCYTIQEKLSFFSDGELVSKEQVVKGKEKPIPLPQDNIGSRMMMKMGWTGAGLGKNQQGIKAPIEASQTMHRAGFGHLSTPQFHSKFRNVFKDYIASGSTNDLVFAPDFSAEERKILHRSIETVEKGNKIIEEDKQPIDEDSENDLFGFDSDSEVMFPISSDDDVEEDCQDREAVMGTCGVCCKLKSLTGEESDDDLYDLIWGSCSDTSGLVNRSQNIDMSHRKINSTDYKCDVNETNRECIESNQSLCHELNKLVTDSPVRTSHTYHGNGALPVLPNETATGIVDPFLQYRALQVLPYATKAGNTNQILEQRAIGHLTPLLILPPLINLQTFPPFLNQSSFLPVFNQPKCTTKKNRGGKKSICLFLPDGSYRRILPSVVDADEELKAFIVESQKSSSKSLVNVTKQDLRTIKALRDLFPELESKLEPKETQSVPDNQGVCGSPTGDIGGLNMKTIIASRETAESKANETLQNPISKSILSNVEDKHKGDDVPCETISESAQSDKITCAASSDMEIDSDLSANQSCTQSQAISQSLPRKQRGAPRIRFILADGSTVRVNSSYLKHNKYFIRHSHREKGIAKGIFKPDEFPPPEYSDSSDESETEWVPKSNLLISEPEDCKIDKVHLLRRNWEQFIIKIGSSTRNPYAKKWQNFVDQSPPGEIKTLCQKWKDFMSTWNQCEARRIPSSILQLAHEPVALPQTRRRYIQPSDSSIIDPNIVTVYTSGFGKLKISKNLILNNKSWTGRKTSCLPTNPVQTVSSQNNISINQTSDIKYKLPHSLCQTSKPDETKYHEELEHHSEKVNVKLGEDKGNCCMTGVSESREKKTISICSVGNEHDGISEIYGEYSEKSLSSSYKLGSSERSAKSCTLPMTKKRRPPKVRFTLGNGSRIRVRLNDLQRNKYFIRYNKRLDGINSGSIKPDEVPPPDYSDSSTDEEEIDWVTKSGLLVTEPEDCDIDKAHLLRKRWEQFILTVGSSKRNPFAKKWREFVDKPPAGERKTICQKWKDFMMIINPMQGNKIPDLVLQEGHKPILSSSQTSLSCDYLGPKLSNELEIHLKQTTNTCSSQLDLEKHVNSCNVTVVHSSIDSSASASTAKSKRVKFNKVKNPDLVPLYLPDGSKVKIDYTLISNNRTTPDWLSRFKL